MDPARVAGGVPAADLQAAGLGARAGLHRNLGPDRIAVGIRLDEPDLGPVAHGQRRAVAMLSGILGAKIAEQRDVRAAVDLQNVETAVEIEVGDQRAAALAVASDPRLLAGFRELAVPLAEEQVARVLGGEIRHLLEIALRDENVEEASVVEI